VGWGDVGAAVGCTVVVRFWYVWSSEDRREGWVCFGVNRGAISFSWLCVEDENGGDAY
jgi:hypothetical protein